MPDETIAVDSGQVSTVDVTPAPDPDAPFGRRADGTPYKRDPSFFAHLRGSRGSAKTTAKRTMSKRAPRTPQPSPSRPARPARPEYAKRIVGLGMVGLTLVPDPVDRAIAEAMLPPWAATAEALAIAYPPVGAMLDRVLLAGDGAGPVVDFTLATVSFGGLIALNHGASHPLLIAMFGAQLQQLQHKAMQDQAARERQERELREMLGKSSVPAPAPAPEQTPESAESWAA